MSDPRPIHLALDEADFGALIQGGVVEKSSLDGRLVRIILSDIGYGVMVRRLSDQMLKSASMTRAAERGETL